MPFNILLPTKNCMITLKSGLNQESTIKNKIDQTKLQIESIHKKEDIYHDDVR